ncbi:MAG: 1-deoxy-D-xylulose-5-phosphate synthase [Tenericutes bacterium]|nr:1-deoxy-D-xylulose-5-phosphate synthase [Mycoplasmatota bacterium]
MEIGNIKNPSFLKKMSVFELEELSRNIRNFLIDKISITGGHLSSNLGIVDLTIAIHKVFNAPKDKIIFDVGHQSYTHKILTGRAHEFDKLRQYNGLSGFQKMSESIYDCYEAGHSSTSLSAALGYAIARDLDKKKHNVVAIIGDGSIGNGLAYEALNHIGSLNTKLIVILNDNEMSISKNVGAIHNTLDKIRSNFKNEKIKKVPYLGKKIKSGTKLIKESFKKIYMKEGYLFEEFGFTYYGPINGHDYDEMISYLEMAKKSNRPVLLHVITEKGKGYKYAESDIEGIWHGISPFDKETGIIKSKNDGLISWSEVISNHLIDIAKINKDIVVITPAMANGSKLNKFKEIYKDRFIDVGIAEEHALVMANSMAIAGKKPFVSIYSTFLQRGYDQVFHDIARMDSNVVIGIDRAGIVGEDGETHQGLYDIAFLNHIPNMIIAAPKNSSEAKGILEFAFNSKHPFAIRYSKQRIEYNNESLVISDYSWEEIKKGSDAVIITYGDFVNNAKIIANNLKKDKLNIGIINARFIKPIDTSMLDKIIKTKKPIIVYEEACLIGSLGSMISSYIVNSNTKIKCFGIKDTFVKQGKYDIIIKKLGLDVDTMTSNIKEFLGGKK